MESDSELRHRLASARARTIAAISDLDDDRLLGPKLDDRQSAAVGDRTRRVVPGEVGPAPCRRPGCPPARTPTRCSTPPRSLTTRAGTCRCGRARRRSRYLERSPRARARPPGRRRLPRRGAVLRDLLRSFTRTCTSEAFAYSRQTLGWPAPRDPAGPAARGGATDSWRRRAASGDVEVPGGVMRLGAERVRAVRVRQREVGARRRGRAVPHRARGDHQGEFAAFVDDGGYARRDSGPARAGRGARPAADRIRSTGAARGGRWERRDFDRWVPLEPQPARRARELVRGRGVLPLGRPAAADRGRVGGRGVAARAAVARSAAIPWGDEPPDATRARLDAVRARVRRRRRLRARRRADGLPADDRQRVGVDGLRFRPYPGFVRDPYAEYSEPWFGTHEVLRGGCFATRAAACSARPGGTSTSRTGATSSPASAPARSSGSFMKAMGWRTRTAGFSRLDVSRCGGFSLRTGARWQAASASATAVPFGVEPAKAGGPGQSR